MNDAWGAESACIITLRFYLPTCPSLRYPRVYPTPTLHLSYTYLPSPPTATPRSPPCPFFSPPCPKVKEHSSVYDLWMVIRGRVYDFTAFLQGEAGGHPGGAEILAAYAGADGASQPRVNDTRVQMIRADMLV